MQVRFTKVDAKRYRIAIDRDHGPQLLERYAPGNDDLMPHDLAHYVIEEVFGIELGVWGQLAAGGGGIFYPAPEDNSLQNKKRVDRIGVVGRADMARSEDLVVFCVSAWERSVGRVKHQTRHVGMRPTAAELERAVRRLDEVSGQWSELGFGSALTFTWPRHLTFNGATSQRGRRARSSRPVRATS